MLKQLVPRPIRSRLARLLLPKTPVIWANWGRFSDLLAAAIPPRHPPLLILSMPRSGSSWVGEVMGSSQRSLYLREPFSQSLLRANESAHVVRELDGESLPVTYQESAESISRGLPLFGPNIVRSKEQWRLAGRRHKRVVIKEVNPLMMEWLVGEIEPKIIYLMRHPAAVAESYGRLGWTGTPLESRFFQTTLRRYPAVAQHTHSFWAAHGATQAIVLNEVANTAQHNESCRIVRYEDICKDPIAAFKELYDFAELPWDINVEQRIIEYSNPRAVDTDSYGILRDSAHEMDKWKRQLSNDQVEQVRDAWLAFEPPAYREHEW